MMQGIKRKIDGTVEPVGETLVNIRVAWRKGDQSILAAEQLVQLKGCGNPMGAFKRAIDKLETELRGKFENDEIADLTNHFINAARTQGFATRGGS